MLLARSTIASQTDVQQRVSKGLQAFRATCRDAGGDFASLQQSERERLLRELDVAAQADEEALACGRARARAPGLFQLRNRTHLSVALFDHPGRCGRVRVPLEPGQPAWD